MTQVLQVTESAADYFRPRLTEMQGWIRLAVKPSGCSGYQYDIAPCEAPMADDLCENHHGLDICIDKKSAPMLIGTTIDHKHMSAGQQKIVFDNPMAQDYCGCGVSFSLKEDE